MQQAPYKRTGRPADAAMAMWGVALLVAVTGPSSAPAEASTPQLPRHPNIVFILIDDLGWSDLGCYGNQFNETPAIDRLCSEGIKFTDFYAASPVCSSTRASIQAGQYPARVGITDFIPGHWRPFEKLVVPPIEHLLPASLKTPGHLLGAAGYATAYFGKWHLGPEATAGPDKRGYRVTARTLPASFRDWHKGRRPGPKRVDLLTDQALWFIEQNQARPFFVTISHFAVHIPVEANAETIRKYRDKQRPPAGVNNPAYAAMIEDLDRSVARLLGRLEELGLADRTLVVFTSDNGGLRKIYTGIGEVVTSNAPLRGQKGTLYEGGIRVPLIVRWPGVVQPGTVCHQPATTADLLPTFCAVAGAKLPPQPIDGLSLLPLLLDPQGKLARQAIYFHYPHYHHSRPAGAVRAGDWKLIEFFDGSPLELYNLASDMGETTNLADRMPQRTTRLRSLLAQWRAAVGARMPKPNPNYDPARAGQWWNRRTNRPLDPEAMSRRYRSRTTKPRTGTGNR